MKITAYCHLTHSHIFCNGELKYQCADAENFLHFLHAAYRHAAPGYAKFFKMDPLSKLAFIATHFLIQHSTWEQKERHEKTAIIINNSDSSIAVDKQYQASIETFPSPSLFVYTLPNVMVGEIAIRYKIYGENSVFISEKFDPHQLVRMIQVTEQDGNATQFLTGYIDGNDENGEAFLMLIEEKEEGIPFHLESVISLYASFTK